MQARVIPAKGLKKHFVGFDIRQTHAAFYAQVLVTFTSVKVAHELAGFLGLR